MVIIMSPLLGDPRWHVSSHSSETGCDLLYCVYHYLCLQTSAFITTRGNRLRQYDHLPDYSGHLVAVYFLCRRHWSEQHAVWEASGDRWRQ